MSRVTTFQGSFNSGELSENMSGRVDTEQYQAGLGECTNFIPLIQGGITKRPGTDFIAEVKDSNAVTRVVPFIFGTTQAYVIEVGNLYMRFYRNDARIEVASVPVEIATPYPTADLFQLKFVQKDDILWILHPDYKPMELTRTSHTAWALTNFIHTDGPYLDTNNVLTNTMTPSGLSGTINLTMAAATFVATDVGRMVRFFDSASNWTWLEITVFTSATLVTAVVKGPALASTTASNAWRLGAWSGTTGYPSCGTFHENRLVLSGSNDEPFMVNSSNTGDFWSFAPSAADGTVTDAHSYRFPLLANEVNDIRWMESDQRGILIGTVGAEWLASAASTAAAMTPSNLKITRVDTRGSADISALKIGKAVIYPQRSRKKLRELAYTFQSDGFEAPDMNQLADHITGTGVTELAYQQEPATVAWAVRDDGKLIGMTYDASEQVIAWHLHDLGGTVESIASIPQAVSAFDELYVIVKRTINGVTKRYVEDLDDYWVFNASAGLSAAVFVDSSLKYAGGSTSVLTGLSHLEGELVSILGDGLVQAQKTVSGGQVTLDTPVTSAVVGLPFTSSAETMREIHGANDGTSQNKTKRIHRVAVRLNNSQNVWLGPETGNMEKVTTALISDDVDIPWPKGYDKKGVVRIEHSDPLPLTVTAIVKYMETYDR